jgi:hypothetical protein
MPAALAALFSTGLVILLAHAVGRARALYLRPATVAARSRRHRR